jgi:hypothetical protein
VYRKVRKLRLRLGLRMADVSVAQFLVERCSKATSIQVFKDKKMQGWVGLESRVLTLAERWRGESGGN